MKSEEVKIKNAIEVLQTNLDKIGSVSEWAELIGYGSNKAFKNKFVRHYKIYPGKVLKYIRMISILKTLQTSNIPLLKIATVHSLPDGKAVNSLINYHFECSPSEIREMSSKRFEIFCKAYYEKLDLPPQIPPL